MREAGIPNYSAHTWTNCILGIPLIYIGFYEQSYVDSQFVTIASISFFSSTCLLSPDLDLRHSKPTQNWGIFRLIWIGYPLLFRHRGKSHSLMFSSLTKVVYLLIVSVLLFSIFTFLSQYTLEKNVHAAFLSSQEVLLQHYEDAYERFEPHKMTFFAILTGLAMSDWVHIFTDKVYSAAKKYI